jgi:hypothetical protein
VTHLAPGQRLRSQTCGTEIIVVRAPDGDVELTCGGRSMTVPAAEAAAARASSPSADAGGGTLPGKRYVDEPTGLEVLCTKPGSGLPAADGRDLTIKAAKPLPASD